MQYILIPARLGSKGAPLKNRTLVPKLLEKLDDFNLLSNVILSTNDPILQKFGDRFNIIVHNRPDEFSSDTVSMKSVILNVIEDLNLDPDADILTLYPTYPGRLLDEIIKFEEFYHKHKLTSALCKEDVKTHPYLCLHEEGIYSSTINGHNLYRRQDYPDCFKVSHYLVLTRVSEIKDLTSQLYNNKTGFYYIDEKLDVDYAADLDKVDKL